METINVKFPYLMEQNENGLMFTSQSSAEVDRIINFNHVSIPVTLYTSKAEYKYALGSTVRYVTVDPMFQVGHVTGYDNTTQEMTIEISDDASEVAKTGKVLPRALVNKVMDAGIEKIDLVNLICIDILNTGEEN